MSGWLGAARRRVRFRRGGALAALGAIPAHTGVQSVSAKPVSAKSVSANIGPVSDVAAALIALAVTAVVVAVALDRSSGVGTLSSLRGDSLRPSGTGESAGRSTDDSEQPPDPSVLDVEERVMWLLRQHDGRLKQSRIVEQTEWSKSKVSRVLSRLEADGRIEKTPVGRENVITIRDD